MGYDLRLDVPARAYINSQLLSLLEKGGTLFDAKKHLFSQEPYVHQGLNPYTWLDHDQSVILSLLFCTIVVPREFLDLPRDHQIYKDFDAEKLIGHFTIVEPAQLDSYLFIQCLRNSIAHALFSLKDSDGQVQYEFWTELKPLFRARSDHKRLLQFVSHAGSRLANAVLAKK